MKNLFYFIIMISLIIGCNNKSSKNSQTEKKITLEEAETESLKSEKPNDTVLLGFTFDMDKSAYLKYANKLSKTGKITLMDDESFVYYLLTPDYKCYTRVTPNFYKNKLSKLICNIVLDKSSNISHSKINIATSVRKVFEEKYGNKNGINMFINTSNSGLTTYNWVSGKKRLTFTNVPSFNMINIEYNDIVAERSINSNNNVKIQKHKEVAKTTKKDI